ncbi:hypothetical protein PV327_010371 [Microctonus hyperodae]|uniref:Uncharacterized protein n=1 Tax=Microctonus hyperodae TaxID=165561 RepID=A0AA39FS33_MICHY|nr:hypothetical protein PV327_010371 [Microctonus hyperodae]
MLSSRLSPRVRGQVNKVNKEACVNKILSGDEENDDTSARNDDPVDDGNPGHWMGYKIEKKTQYTLA